MQPEWLKVATGPGLWIIGFVFAGNALIQSFLFYRLSRRVATRLQMSDAGMKTGDQSLVRRVDRSGLRKLRRHDRPGAGARRRLRVRARIGRRRLDHVRAHRGAGGRRGRRRRAHAREHDGVRPSSSSSGSRRSAPSAGCSSSACSRDGCRGSRTLLAAATRRRLQMISVAIMLGAFARLLATDSITPLLRDGRLPPIVASVAGGAASLALAALRGSVEAARAQGVLPARRAGRWA